MSLEALERSDLSRLPGGIFTRAFIRAYAQEVGLDPDRTIQDFIAELPADTATSAAHPVTFEDGEKLESDRRVFVTAARLALMSLPLIGAALYYGTARAPVGASHLPVAASEAQLPGAGVKAHEAVAEQIPGVSGTASEHAGGARQGAVPAASGLVMEIAPRGPCWVGVSADGASIFSGVMNAGDTQVVRAKEEIVLNIGDAGVFAYSLNGQRGRPLGAGGQVISQRITLANLSEFTLP